VNARNGIDRASMPATIHTGNARAGVVNRTRRVVREQALQMREERARTRSLWVPIGIFSVLLPIILFAVWFVIDGYDLTPNGIPDASDQLMVLVMWSVPLTILLVAIVWYRRQRERTEVR
jgi:hypothetical protein